MNRKTCAAYLGVSERTVRYWDAGRYRVPWAVVRLLRFVRCGDLGALHPAWDGFRLQRDTLYTPDNRGFPVKALAHWWITVEQARFWRQTFDQQAQARLTLDATVGSPCGPILAQPVPDVGVSVQQPPNNADSTVTAPAPRVTTNQTLMDLSVPVPLRKDVVIQISGIPADLTAAEADKVARVLKAYATPDNPG